MILAGGKYLEIKASLLLFHQSILFLGKDENQVLARPRNEKKKLQFNDTIIHIFFLLHITQLNESI